MNRSELYLAFLPLLNSGRLDLLDNARMVAQLVGLERRTARSGKDSVDHAPGGHDDIANAVAGAASLALVPEIKIPFVAPIMFALAQPNVPHQNYGPNTRAAILPPFMPTRGHLVFQLGRQRYGTDD